MYSLQLPSFPDVIEDLIRLTTPPLEVFSSWQHNMVTYSIYHQNGYLVAIVRS